MADANYSINISGKDAEKTLKSLKTEAQALAEQLENCVVGSKEFAATKSQLEKVNDTLTSVQQTSLNIGDNIAKVGTGIVGAFQAGLGALTAFGFESEAVNESIQKMTALMSLSQGIKGIIEGVKSMKQLAGAIKTATMASKGLKVALASTGIGLLVVGVGELIAHFEDLEAVWDRLSGKKPIKVLSTEEIEQEEKELNEWIEKNLEEGEKNKYSRLSDSAQKEYTKNLKLNKEYNQQIQSLLAEREKGLITESEYQEKSNGLSTKAANAWAATRKIIEDENNYLGATSVEADEKRAELAQAQADADAAEKEAESRRKQRQAQAKADAEKAAQERSRIAQEAADKEVEEIERVDRLIKTDEQNELADLRDKYDEEYALLVKYGEDTTALTEKYEADRAAIVQKYADAKKEKEEEDRLKKLEDLGVDTSYMQEEENLVQHLQNMQTAYDTAYEQGLISKEQYETAMQNIGKQSTEIQEQQFMAVISASMNTASNFANLMSGISDLIGDESEEAFEASKAFQISAAVINTINGALGAYLGAVSNPGLNAIPVVGPAVAMAMGITNAALVAATGAVQIASISKRKYNDTSTTTSDVGTASTSAVNSTLVAPTQYSQEVSNAKLEESVGNQKVYVTESDIQRTTKKVSVAESESRY